MITEPLRLTQGTGTGDLGLGWSPIHSGRAPLESRMVFAQAQLFLCALPKCFVLLERLLPGTVNETDEFLCLPAAGLGSHWQERALIVLFPIVNTGTLE